MIKLKETLKHAEAFELYFKMGEERSLRELAKKLEVSETTINRWNKEFDWQTRIVDREKEISEKVAEKVIEEEIDLRSKFVSGIKGAIDLFLSNLKNGLVKVESVQDFERLGKLYLEFEKAQPDGVGTQTSVVKRKEVVFDINGEPDEEKDKAGIPVYDDGHIYLNRLIPKIYNEYVYNVLFNLDYECVENVLKGGRNSVKSTVNAILFALTLYMGLGDATASRLTYGKLRGSCFSAIIKQIRKMGIDDCFEYSTKQNSPLLIKCDNGFEGYFFGLDDEQKVRSFEPKNGTHFNWVEEIQVLRKFNDLSNLKATLNRGDFHPLFAYSTNPRPEKSAWTNNELITPSETKYILHTTYLDIPQWWINKNLLSEIEDYKTVYPDLYRNLYLGEVCGGKGLVFRRIKDYIADKSKFTSLLRGLDFGLAKNGDPTSYVVVSIDTKKKELYILDEWYKQDTDYPEIAKEVLKENKNNFTVFCDSADAGGIKQLKIEGVKRATQCKKTKVDTGIKYLQGLTIYIDKDKTPNTYREFTEYAYVENRNGDSVLNEKNNHTIDAVRYALSNYIEGVRK